MINEEIKTYTKPQKFKMKKENFFSELKKTKISELLEYILLFLLCRIRILGALSPFGTAFFAAVFPTHKRSFGIFFACLGVCTGAFKIESLKYMGCIAIISAFSVFLREELKNKRFVYALIAAGSVAANGFIYVAFDGFLLYDILMLALEAIFTFFLYFAYFKASELIKTVKERNYFEAEETISLLILGAAVILGIKTFYYASSAAHIISVATLMILGFSGGAGVATAAGAVFGLVNAVGEPLAAQTVAIYSLCGFTCGLFKKYGKWAVALAFFVTNAVLMVYFNSSADRLLTVGYIAAAAMILYVLPDSVICRFGELAKSTEYVYDSPQERMREILIEKLLSAKEAFYELSAIFGKMVEKKLAPELADINTVYDKTYIKVCDKCGMNKYCWQKKVNDTYDCLGKMYEIMRVRGYAIDVDAPKHFKDYCINFDEFLTVLNKEYEHFRINAMWAGKIIESRRLISSQFGCIAGVLEKISKDVNGNFSENIHTERKILTALDKKGISVSNAKVSEGAGFEVTMSKESCGKNLECSTVIAATVSEVLGVPMLRTSRKCSGDVCRLKFCEQARFKIETGSAMIARNGEKSSGDNFSSRLLDGGKYVVVLSDGMGSGEKANAESTVTVELVKRLLNAGFDKQTAAELINSVLMTNANDESFATADVCIVNLYTGTAEFLKTGAASSFVKRENGTEEILSSSLPLGLIEKNGIDLDYKSLKSGDYIVMLTDGITEAVSLSGRSVSELVEAFSGDNPKQLADGIMAYALQASHNKPKDDMTIFTLKITEVM